jgi:hypothetical protein
VIFYAIYKKQGNSLYYFSCTFAAGTLERNFSLQCGPWGRLAGACEQNPASLPVLAAGEGRGEGLGLLGARFGCWLGPGRRPARGAPVASGGGRRGQRCGAAGPRRRLARAWLREERGGTRARRADRPPLNCRRSPYRRGRTAGPPSVPTAVRRRRDEPSRHGLLGGSGRGHLGACHLVSRESLERGEMALTPRWRDARAGARDARRRGTAPAGPTFY